MHASFLFRLFSLIDSLQYQVRTVRSFDCYHLQLKFVSYYHSWERKFANFTLKFIEIVSLHDSNNLFFYLAINPLLKTLNMNISTKSFTFAWGYQKVVFFIILTKTNFTCSLHPLCRFKYSIKLTQKNIF